MKTLIVKRSAAGDVVRTTTLCHILNGELYWLTDDLNIALLEGLAGIKRCFAWSFRDDLKDEFFDLIINLEDSRDVAQVLDRIEHKRVFGAYLCKDGSLGYTDDSRGWFDLSLISRHGKVKADEFKFSNEKCYQELIFAGLGYGFKGEPYLLPDVPVSAMEGDIAIAPKCGSVWPMKNWAYFDELKVLLQNSGYKVNYLPERGTLLEHISDIKAHKYLVSGDSLPMHIALGYGIKCLSIFICTSPWEIYDYGCQRKVVAPHLKKYFYKRSYDPNASRSISLEEVYQAVISHIEESEQGMHSDAMIFTRRWDDDQNLIRSALAGE